VLLCFIFFQHDKRLLLGCPNIFFISFFLNKNDEKDTKIHTPPFSSFSLSFFYETKHTQTHKKKKEKPHLKKEKIF
jgi:hypothetical protein